MFNCKTCNIEGEEHFYKTQKWYCKSCWNKRTAQTQKDKVKQIKLDYGAKCTRCGYDKCLDALQFHHTDPSQKDFHLGERRGLSLDKLKSELNKCIMVCSNCHIEIHSNLRLNEKDRHE